MICWYISLVFNQNSNMKTLGHLQKHYIISTPRCWDIHKNSFLCQN